MKYLKLFEAYFNGDDITWEEISSEQHQEFGKDHPKILNYKYDDVFDIFDSAYNLYQKDEDDLNNNQYRITPSSLEIYLVSKKTDIFISAHEDSWYSIRVCKYRNHDDVDYYSSDYYLADDIEGVDEWLAQS